MQKNSSESCWDPGSISGTYSDTEMIEMALETQYSLKEMAESVKDYMNEGKNRNDFKNTNTTLSNVFGVTFHTEDEVAEFLKISKRKLQMLRKENKIGFDRIAGRIRYSCMHIYYYLKKCKEQKK